MLEYAKAFIEQCLSHLRIKQFWPWPGLAKKGSALTHDQELITQLLRPKEDKIEFHGVYLLT